LDRYLTAPRDIATGTKMTFPGVKDPKKRADIIAYLATLQ
jgi:cytochrome c